VKKKGKGKEKGMEKVKGKGSRSKYCTRGLSQSGKLGSRFNHICFSTSCCFRISLYAQMWAHSKKLNHFKVGALFCRLDLSLT